MPIPAAHPQNVCQIYQNPSISKPPRRLPQIPQNLNQTNVEVLPYLNEKVEHYNSSVTSEGILASQRLLEILNSGISIHPSEESHIPNNDIDEYTV